MRKAFFSLAVAITSIFPSLAAAEGLYHINNGWTVLFEPSTKNTCSFGKLTDNGNTFMVSYLSNEEDTAIAMVIVNGNVVTETANNGTISIVKDKGGAIQAKDYPVTWQVEYSVENNFTVFTTLFNMDDVQYKTRISDRMLLVFNNQTDLVDLSNSSMALNAMGFCIQARKSSTQPNNYVNHPSPSKTPPKSTRSKLEELLSD